MKKPVSHSQMGFFLSFLLESKKVPYPTISGLFQHNKVPAREETQATWSMDCFRGL